MRRTKKLKSQIKRGGKKKTAIKVVIRKTGIAHHFDDVAGWEKLMALFESKYGSKQKADLVKAASFDSFM